MAKPAKPSGPSQRQLRVGELIRHALAEMLARGDIHDDVLAKHVVTVPEVRLSPDLKLATCYIMPLGGLDIAPVLKALDANKRYLLQDNIAGEFPYMLLGKPVYLSDNMAAIAAGAKTVLYGDYSGLAVNIREGVSVQVLREKYATQHAIGVNGWLEMDSKVVDNQKLAILVQKAV